MTASSSADTARGSRPAPTHDARRQRVADPPADRLPARVADVDGRRERAAEERADHGADAVGQQDLAQVVVVARRAEALSTLFMPSVKL